MALPNLAFILLLIWPLVFGDLDFANSKVISKYDVLPSQGDCVNCTICPYPCHSMSPPPSSSSSGYPLYGAPPPPASIYPSFGAPPPPQAQVDQGNCPPAVPPQCCHYPAPPSPPNTYTYVPNYNFCPSPFANIFLFSILILLASFAVLF